VRDFREEQEADLQPLGAPDIHHIPHRHHA